MAVELNAPGKAFSFDPAIVKFLAFPALSLLVVIEVAFGGAWFAAILPTYVLIVLFADESLGDDMARGSRLRARLLDAYLYTALPLALLVSLFLALHASGTVPTWIAGPLGAIGFDIDARVAQTELWHLAIGLVGLGLFFGTLVNVAHELIHRTGNRAAWLNGRWLLAHTLDTGFAIEHIHGHHRYVGTDRDPATARRGEYVLSFVLRSTIGQVRSAWAHERNRLQRRGLPVLSRHNVFLRGQLMSVALVALVAAVGGWRGIVAFLVAAILGKVALELVNYVEHYGLARIEGTKVAPHHSWNCHNRLSSWVLFNLPRHSDHHMVASRPYYDLRTVPDLPSDAPVLPMGYLGCMLVSLVKPAWRALIDPRLADWDARLATSAEVSAARARSVA